MNLVPINAVPSQVIKTVLAGSIVELAVYQRRYGLYIDVTINGTLEIGAVVCENLNRIIRSLYLNEKAGFEGDFVFNDLQGKQDPYYTGLGTRYQLIYLTQSELEAMGFDA